jgi:hypothetical protein
MDLAERIATLEAEYRKLDEDVHEIKNDMKGLVALITKHMENEEKDRKILMSKLQAIETAQAKMSGYRNGIAAAVTVFWALAGGVIYFFNKHT